MVAPRIAFGSFVLDTSAGTLLQQGVAVPVSYRGLLLLAAFLKRPGEVLTKPELMDAAWPGTAVEESNLFVQIASLRKLLGSSLDGAEWIVTVPRVGYRFTGKIETPGGASNPIEQPTEAGPSIAILPFANLSDDVEQQYFADGLAEDISTRLARLHRLVVSARNSSFTYKSKAADAKQIGRELGVRYVLDGSVRRSGQRLRISSRLSDALTGLQVWAEQYDVEMADFFALQDKIAESVIAAIEPLLEIPNKPSLAVLPFANLSGEENQAYFCDGVVEDIITELSRYPWLFVIARNTSFTYRERVVDLKQVGRELGIRYIVEGSIRKSGEIIRVTAQLVDASGSHIWAERYDRKLTDIFEVQDEITQSIAGALEPALKLAEIERSKRKRPEHLDAYDLYLRALPGFYAMTREGSDDAIGLLRRAMALDPSYAAPVAMLAYCLIWRISQGWGLTEEIGPEAARYARLGVQLDNENSDALAIAARCAVYLDRQHEEAMALAQRAVENSPSSANAWSMRGWIHLYFENSKSAVTDLKRALRLSPRGVMNCDVWAGLAIAYIFAGLDEEAISAARTATTLNVHYIPGWRMLGAALALAGRSDEARVAAGEMLKLHPTFSITKWIHQNAYLNGATRLVEGFRGAGLPP
jgi:TolB-like protein